MSQKYQAGSKRIRLVELAQGSLDIEYTREYVILHLPRVTNFKKSDFLLMKNYLRDLADFIAATGLKGPYAAVNDDKTEKLAVKLGFTYLGTHGPLKVYTYATNSPGNYSSNGSGLHSSGNAVS